MSTSDKTQTLTSVKKELTKQAFGSHADEVDGLRTELAKIDFEARKQLIKAQSGVFERRKDIIKGIPKVC